VRRTALINSLLRLGVVALAAAGVGCATPDAPDVQGRWRPLSQYAEVPQAIPLQQAYVYQVSPADGTLKTLLARWAKDAKVTLAYQHPNDYTLHAPVAQIRTTSLQQAAAALTSAYAQQGVRVDAMQSRIVVSQAQSEAPQASTVETGTAPAGG